MDISGMITTIKRMPSLIAKVAAILLLFLIFMSATVDTHRFVYPSLSRSLISEILILFMSIIALLYCIIKKRSFIHDEINCFILAWILYIVVHYACMQPHEQYRTVYLVISLLLVLTASVFLRCHLISRTQCENIILSAAVIQVIFVFMQWIGIADSGNEYFVLTGANENPTVTALYLTGCIPVIVAKIYNGERRVFHSLFLFACFSVIVALQCRTAFIGLLTELLVAMAIFIRIRGISFTKSHGIPILLAMVTFMTAAGTRLYVMKLDSSEGRILIWNIATKMIIEKPLGYGYGLFENYYNLRQAAFFSNGNGSETEKRLAGHVSMPYNDFLEHGVEGGVIGMVFLTAFYRITISVVIKKKDIVCSTVLAAFAVMSLTNFIYSSIQPWLLLMLFTSFITSNNSDEKVSQSKINYFFVIVAIVLILVFTARLLRMTIGQMKLYEYKEAIVMGGPVPDEEFAFIENDIGTSEVYWTLRAYNNLLQERYSEATDNLSESLKYTSMSQTMEMAYHACRLKGDEKQGIRYVEVVRNMVSCLLRPRLLLMQYYDSHGDIAKALCCAREIVASHIKVDNEKARLIRSAAYDYILSHQ